MLQSIETRAPRGRTPPVRAVGGLAMRGCAPVVEGGCAVSARLVAWLLRCTAADPWTARKGRWLNTVVLGLLVMLLLFFSGGLLFPASGSGQVWPVIAALAL